MKLPARYTVGVNRYRVGGHRRHSAVLFRRDFFTKRAALAYAAAAAEHADEGVCRLVASGRRVELVDVLPAPGVR